MLWIAADVELLHRNALRAQPYECGPLLTDQAEEKGVAVDCVCAVDCRKNPRCFCLTWAMVLVSILGGKSARPVRSRF